MKKILMYFSLILIVFVIFVALYFNFEMNREITMGKRIKLNVRKGSSIESIIDSLNKHEIAIPKAFYKYYLKYISYIDSKYIQAGVYLFPDNISSSDIFDALFEGKHLYISKVTFPEGINYKQFASILKQKALIDSVDFVRLAQSDSLLKARNIPAKSIEGYILPDTYEFFTESSAAEAIDKLLNAHSNIYNRILSQSSNKAGLNKHQILTLASIVEAETPEDDERSVVAGLYLNRLKKNMLLQADPTVAYIFSGKKRLLYEDLKIDNPYNTYKYVGLPPAPINNPGAKSIRAALNPDSHNFLYMVLVGDGTRRHNFSKNYDEHLKFVNLYRKNIKKNARD